jgi:hypothetical protein
MLGLGCQCFNPEHAMCNNSEHRDRTCQLLPQNTGLINMRYPRYKPETILRLREAGPTLRPDGKIRQHVYHDPMPGSQSQHSFQRGVYRWVAALTIPFAISYVTSSLPGKKEKGVNKVNRRRRSMS